MRRGIVLGLVPVLLAGAGILSTPAPAQAANGTAETAVTTYTLNTDKAQVDVTVQIKVKNNIPPKTESCGYLCTKTINTYVNTTFIQVPVEASAVAVKSNAGTVKQSVEKSYAFSRVLRLTYPSLWYGQTRTVTATYSIPGAPGSPGAFRSLRAYASLCVWGNGAGTGLDSQTVNVAVPDTFAVASTYGLELSKATAANGLQTYSSGSVPAGGDTYACLQATNPAGLTSASGKVGSAAFTIMSWPEDPDWASRVSGYIESDGPKLEALTGLSLPDGLTIYEAGAQEFGGYSGRYDWQAKSISIAEGASEAFVVRGVGLVLLGPLFADFWITDGFAQYGDKVLGEGQYKPCADPGAYPGSGPADLATVKLITLTSPEGDLAIAAWQLAKSCYLITTLADLIGPENLKVVLNHAAFRVIAYTGAGAPEIYPDQSTPLSAKQFIDLIDELGMVPAGVADLDLAQNLLSGLGIFSESDLQARSQARAAYHALAAKAGAWKLPLVIRASMAQWDFSSAQTAMATASRIIDARDEATNAVAGLSLVGTPLQSQFESASTMQELNAVLSLALSEADAAAKVGQAKALDSSGRNPVEMIGMVGSNVTTSMNKANDALLAAEPEDASAAAQEAIDTIHGSFILGIIRLAVVMGTVALLGLYLRRRRSLVPSAAGALAGTAAPGEAMDEPLLQSRPFEAPPQGDSTAGMPGPGPAQTEGGPVSSATAADQGALADRLRQLDDARRAGLISDDEHAESKARLLKDL